jgi:hypothetical protein
MTRREELENRIADAADGILNAAEMKQLEEELSAFPELLSEYRSQLQLSGLEGVYGQTAQYRNGDAVQGLMDAFDHIDRERGPEVSHDKDDSVVYIYSRYALAASLALFAILSIFYLVQGGGADLYLAAEELYYPMEESSGEEYVLYLEELFASE